jgi:hypothetical protein
VLKLFIIISKQLREDSHQFKQCPWFVNNISTAEYLPQIKTYNIRNRMGVQWTNVAIITKFNIFARICIIYSNFLNLFCI